MQLSLIALIDAGVLLSALSLASGHARTRSGTASDTSDAGVTRVGVVDALDATRQSLPSASSDRARS